ncbi:MAG: hypothetical protein JNJ77_15135 [Planctomycetia bacterium]|nr:hypothetical protein [Planctomycetia bacterium]
MNEKSFFSLPEIKTEFAKYTLLKQYTDTVPLEYYPVEKLQATTIDVQEADAEKIKKFQKERFKDIQLPLYVIIEPDGDDFREVARYPLSVIRDASDFANFLRKNATNQ